MAPRDDSDPSELIVLANAQQATSGKKENIQLLTHFKGVFLVSFLRKTINTLLDFCGKIIILLILLLARFVDRLPGRIFLDRVLQNSFFWVLAILVNAPCASAVDFNETTFIISTTAVAQNISHIGEFPPLKMYVAEYSWYFFFSLMGLYGLALFFIMGFLLTVFEPTQAVVLAEYLPLSYAYANTLVIFIELPFYSTWGYFSAILFLSYLHEDNSNLERIIQIVRFEIFADPARNVMFRTMYTALMAPLACAAAWCFGFTLGSFNGYPGPKRGFVYAFRVWFTTFLSILFIWSIYQWDLYLFKIYSTLAVLNIGITFVCNYIYRPQIHVIQIPFVEDEVPAPPLVGIEPNPGPWYDWILNWCSPERHATMAAVLSPEATALAFVEHVASLSNHALFFGFIRIRLHEQHPLLVNAVAYEMMQRVPVWGHVELANLPAAASTEQRYDMIQTIFAMHCLEDDDGYFADVESAQSDVDTDIRIVGARNRQIERAVYEKNKWKKPSLHAQYAAERKQEKADAIARKRLRAKRAAVVAYEAQSAPSPELLKFTKERIESAQSAFDLTGMIQSLRLGLHDDSAEFGILLTRVVAFLAALNCATTTSQLVCAVTQFVTSFITTTNAPHVVAYFLNNLYAIVDFGAQADGGFSVLEVLRGMFEGGEKLAALCARSTVISKAQDWWYSLLSLPFWGDIILALQGSRFEFVLKLFKAGAIASGVGSVAIQTVQFIKFMFQRGWMAWQAGDWEIFFYDSDSFMQFAQKVIDYRYELTTLHATDPEFKVHPRETYLLRGHELLAECKKRIDKVRKNKEGDVRSLMLIYDELADVILTVQVGIEAAKIRVPPMTVLICSPPKYGKTSIVTMVQWTLAKAMGCGIGNEYVYNWTLGKKFADGLTDAHTTCILDDVGAKSVNEPGQSADMQQIIQLVNPVGFVADMAAIEKKGKQAAAFKIVIATTNNISLNAYAFAACPLAVARRFPIILVPSIKLEYQDDKRALDPAKLSKMAPDFLDFATYDVKVPESNPNHKGGVSYRVLHSNLSTDELRAYLVKSAKDHMLHGHRMVESIKLMQSKEMCSGCGRVGGACEGECAPVGRFTAQSELPRSRFFFEGFIFLLSVVAIYLTPWTMFLSGLCSALIAYRVFLTDDVRAAVRTWGPFRYIALRFHTIKYDMMDTGQEVIGDYLVHLAHNGYNYTGNLMRENYGIEEMSPQALLNSMEELGNRVMYRQMLRLKPSKRRVMQCAVVAAGVLLAAMYLYYAAAPPPQVSQMGTTFGRPPAPDPVPYMGPVYHNDVRQTSNVPAAIRSSPEAIVLTMLQESVLQAMLGSDESSLKRGNVVALGGQCYACAAHYLTGPKLFVKLERSAQGRQAGTMFGKVKEVLPQHFHVFATKDILVFRLLGTLPQASLRKWLPLAPWSGTNASIRLFGWLNDTQFLASGKGSVTKDHIYTLGSTTLHLDVTLKYVLSDVETAHSMCGSLAILDGPDGVLVYGLHVSGIAGTGVGTATELTLAMYDEALAKLNVDVPNIA
jgi:hypothetical protein